jgi:heat shock protein HslJ
MATSIRRGMRDLHRRVFVLALLGSLSQLACSDAMTQPVSPSQNIGLVGTEWSVVQLNGQSPGITAGAAAPTLLLAQEDARAGGFAGCNRFTATYALTSDRLRFSPIATTRMFCNEGMDLEQRYVTALEATRAYRLVGPRLELVADAGVVARFEAR